MSDLPILVLLPDGGVRMFPLLPTDAPLLARHVLTQFPNHRLGQVDSCHPNIPPHTALRLGCAYYLEPISIAAEATPTAAVVTTSPRSSSSHAARAPGNRSACRQESDSRPSQLSCNKSSPVERSSSRSARSDEWGVQTSTNTMSNAAVTPAREPVFSRAATCSTASSERLPGATAPSPSHHAAESPARKLRDMSAEEAAREFIRQQPSASAAFARRQQHPPRTSPLPPRCLQQQQTMHSHKEHFSRTSGGMEKAMVSIEDIVFGRIK